MRPVLMSVQVKTNAIVLPWKETLSIIDPASSKHYYLNDINTLLTRRKVDRP